jgi:predicted nucleic-acid-binding Zn-ribbon protein
MLGTGLAPNCCEASVEQEKRNMETSSATSVTSATSETAINFDSNIFHAVLCHRCGTKIYPAQQMEAHLDRHVIKDMFLEGELKKLQYSMGRMR